MSVMSVRVDDEKRRLLKAIASLEDKTIGSLVGELIEAYIERNRQKLEREGKNSRNEKAATMTFEELALKVKANSRGKRWKREELYRV